MNEYDKGYHDGTVHHLDKIDRLTAQLAEWYKVFGHLSKDADTAGNMINEGIAERDKEIEKLTHAGNRMASDCNKLFAENAALRAEVERLSLENRQMLQQMKWDKQNIELGRKQAARECYIIAQNILVTAMKRDNFIGDATDDLLDEIKTTFGLEG